jgi:hypothetical protein
VLSVLLSLGGGPGGDPFGGGPWCGGPPGGGPPSGGGPGGPPCAVLNANIPTLSWRTPYEQFIKIFFYVSKFLTSTSTTANTKTAIATHDTLILLFGLAERSLGFISAAEDAERSDNQCK